MRQLLNKSFAPIESRALLVI